MDGGRSTVGFLFRFPIVDVLLCHWKNSVDLILLFVSLILGRGFGFWDPALILITVVLNSFVNIKLKSQYVV